MTDIQVTRGCDGCTECCRGWLTGAAYGKSFYSGKPCHFAAENSCTIYKDRPHDPCVIFRCGWLDNPNDFPEWLKPSISKVLIKKSLTKKSNIEYLSAYECGKVIDAKSTMYLVLYAINNAINIAIQIEGGWSYIGSKEFLVEMNS